MWGEETGRSHRLELLSTPVLVSHEDHRHAVRDDNRQNNFTVAFPTASKQKQLSILSSNSTRGTSVAQYSSFET